jgi:hypothetical protein
VEQIVADFLSQQSGTTAAWIGGVAFVVWLIIKIKKVVSAVWPFVHKLIIVVEDLFGTEARPGVDARPGLMERMKTSEENDIQITATLQQHSEALLELRPNHGGSMKDLVRSISNEQKALREAFDLHVKAQQGAGSTEASVTVNVAPIP